jgi:hypothetical protein
MEGKFHGGAIIFVNVEGGGLAAEFWAIANPCKLSGIQA